MGVAGIGDLREHFEMVTSCAPWLMGVVGRSCGGEETSSGVLSKSWPVRPVGWRGKRVWLVRRGAVGAGLQERWW